MTPVTPNVCPCCEQEAPLAAWDGYCAACDEAHCPCGEGEWCCMTGSIEGEAVEPPGLPSGN